MGYFSYLRDIIEGYPTKEVEGWVTGKTITVCGSVNCGGDWVTVNGQKIRIKDKELFEKINCGDRLYVKYTKYFKAPVKIIRLGKSNNEIEGACQ